MPPPTNPSPAYTRFSESMLIDYSAWKEGTPYDIAALSEITPEERDLQLRAFTISPASEPTTLTASCSADHFMLIALAEAWPNSGRPEVGSAPAAGWTGEAKLECMFMTASPSAAALPNC